MKYLTIIVMSLTVLLFAACSSGGGEPTTEPEPEATETKPALETAVPTEAPAATDEAYPTNPPTPEPVDSYPGGENPTVEPYDPYPDQEAETSSDVVTDSAYPAEGNASDTPSEAGDGDPQEAPKPGVPDDSTATTHQVSQDLAERIGVDISEITAASIEAVEWGDSSLGCPASGYAYAQIITPGYQIVLEVDGEQFDYHTDLKGNFVLCGEEGSPVE